MFVHDVNVIHAAMYSLLHPGMSMAVPPSWWITCPASGVLRTVTDLDAGQTSFFSMTVRQAGLLLRHRGPPRQRTEEDNPPVNLFPRCRYTAPTCSVESSP